MYVCMYVCTYIYVCDGAEALLGLEGYCTHCMQHWRSSKLGGVCVGVKGIALFSDVLSQMSVCVTESVKTQCSPARPVSATATGL